MNSLEESVALQTHEAGEEVPDGFFVAYPIGFRFKRGRIVFSARSSVSVTPGCVYIKGDSEPVITFDGFRNAQITPIQRTVIEGPAGWWDISPMRQSIASRLWSIAAAIRSMGERG